MPAGDVDYRIVLVRARAEHDIAALERERQRWYDAVDREIAALDLLLKLDPRPRTTIACYRAWLAVTWGRLNKPGNALEMANAAVADLEAASDAASVEALAAIVAQRPVWEEAAAAARRDLATWRCSFCNRPGSEILKLISGKGGVTICDRCVGAAEGTLDRDYPRDAPGAPRRGTRAPTPPCNFCGKEEAIALVQGPACDICDDCIDLCLDIIAEEIHHEQLASDD
jgi:hypothetical protein